MSVGSRRRDLRIGIRLAALLAACSLVACGRVNLDALPGKVSDQTFWNMVATFSEPDGVFQAQGGFRSDNLVSNERSLQDVIPALEAEDLRGAYLGVGPEQNFTYVAALRPTIAFVIDIRRQNMLVHLMYKALFELSADRADFLARLFARTAPTGMRRDSSASTLLAAFRTVAGSEEAAHANVSAIVSHLERAHGFPLSPADEAGIKRSYWPFYERGPDIRWDPDGGSWIPSYAELMSQTDRDGRPHGYLASEINFQIVKRYQTNNRIVPLVGDFAGDKTIRAVGQYLKEQRDIVAAFYTSNVQAYFTGDAPTRFIENVSTLPFDEHSRFIRTRFQTTSTSGKPEYRTSTVMDSIQAWVNVRRPRSATGSPTQTR